MLIDQTKAKRIGVLCERYVGIRNTKRRQVAIFRTVIQAGLADKWPFEGAGLVFHLQKPYSGKILCRIVRKSRRKRFNHFISHTSFG